MICPACHSENIEGADECVNCGLALYGLDLPGAPLGSQAPAFLLLPIASLPKRKVASLTAHDPVALAVRHMKRTESNCVLVTDGDRLRGIITDRDIVQKVAAPYKDLNAITCGQIMTARPLVLHDEDTLAEALNMMASGGFRHIPIIDGGTPTGVLFVNDVFRHISPQLV
jgi:CBS domain-containing protein